MAADATSPTPADLSRERPLRELLRIAIPSVATMSSYTVMQFADGLMVSRITPADPIYIAAQNNGGLWVWTPLSILIGITGMVNSYVSQHLGAGEPRKAPAYAWNALYLSLLWAILLIPYGLALPALFRAAGHEDRLIAIETGYAQILIFGAFITLSNKTLAQFFYGMHRPWVVLSAAITGNVVNLACNQVLIFGTERLHHLGIDLPFEIPAMSVNGAAIATVIGTFVELLIPLALFLSPRLHADLGTRSAWRIQPRIIADLFRKGWSPALMHGNEMICWTIFMTTLVAKFGPNHNAASAIAIRFMQISFMPAVGLSFAITAVVGKAMGANRPDLAEQRAWMGVRVAFIYMTVCAILMAAFRKQLVSVFIQDGMDPAIAADVLRIGSGIMIVAAAFQVFDAFGISLVGALRGAGDTVVPGVVTMILAWTLIVGLGYLMVFLAPGLGAIGPWIAAAVYCSVFGVWLAIRFSRGKWKSIRLIESPAISAH